MGNIPEEVLLALAVKNSGGGGGTSDYDQLSNKPQIGGVTLSGNKSASDLSLASLDSNGKVPAAQLPSYVDDVINGYLHDGKFYEDDQYTTEIAGEDGKIYVDLATNKTYRWSGLAFVEISESLALGETSSTAYAGDKGKANADAITAIKDGQSIDSFGDVETALAGKQATLSAGSHIDIDSNTVSVQRWAVPAGKVVYTVITSDENYGQNVHVQRHTEGGVFIDDRTYTVMTFGSATVDDVISIVDQYGKFNISLLKNSDEQQAGYSYIVQPTTTPTSNSFTFTMAQEENDNDLIIREELDDVDDKITAIKDGQSIDSFGGVETALASKADLTDLAPAFSTSTTYTVGQYVSYDGNIYKCTSAHSAGAWVAGDFTIVAVASELEAKQPKTDNSLTTTSKDTTGAINEVNSILTSLGLSVVNGKLCQTYSV